MHEMEALISGDYYISSLKKSNITELVPSEDENDDRWYKAKISIIDADEVSGKEKSSAQYYLVAASNINRHWKTWKKVYLPLSCLMKLTALLIPSLWMCFLIFQVKKNRYRRI